jgi:hypothetical protein
MSICKNSERFSGFVIASFSNSSRFIARSSLFSVDTEDYSGYMQPCDPLPLMLTGNTGFLPMSRKSAEIGGAALFCPAGFCIPAQNGLCRL